MLMSISLSIEQMITDKLRVDDIETCSPKCISPTEQLTIGSHETSLTCYFLLLMANRALWNAPRPGRLSKPGAWTASTSKVFTDQVPLDIRV